MNYQNESKDGAKNWSGSFDCYSTIFCLIIAVMCTIKISNATSLRNDQLGIYRHIHSEKYQGKITDDNQEHKKFYLGLSTGFPFLFSINAEHLLKVSNDRMPLYLVTTNLGVKYYGSYAPKILEERYGLCASATIESRLGNSYFYAGCGYNYSLFVFGFQIGDMGVGGDVGIHSVIFSCSARSSYMNHISLRGSLGFLINLSIWDELPIFPFVRVSLIRAN